MAEIMMTLGALGAKLLTAATTAGSWAAANAGTIGAIASAGGTIYGGVAAKQASDFEAKSLKRKGDAEFAAGQREAMRRRKETEIILSRQKAVAASSGAGATDPTVEAIMGKTQQEGDYSAMMDMYNGAINRADLYAEAKSAKTAGNQDLMKSFFDAGRTIYSDFSDRRRRNSIQSLY